MTEVDVHNTYRGGVRMAKMMIIVVDPRDSCVLVKLSYRSRSSTSTFSSKLKGMRINNHLEGPCCYYYPLSMRYETKVGATDLFM